MERKFGMRDKIGYALGDTGCNFSFSLITNYMYQFYTQYMILPAKIYSIGILILKIWDAINDPIMGSIIDRKRIGTGSKFKPWIKIGSYGLIISAALFFLPFPNASVPVKTILFLGSYLIWDLCYTFVNVPYGAMNSTITVNPTERTQLSVYRSIGAGLSTVMCMALPALVYNKNNELMGGRFFPIAVVMGIMAFFCFFGLNKMTTERVAPAISSGENISYKTAVKAFFKNRPLLGLGIASFAQIVFFNSTAISACSLVFQTYFKRADLITIGTIISYCPMVIGVLFGTKLSKKFGKKLAAGVPFIISIAASVMMYVINIQPDQPIIWIIGFGLINIGGGIFTIITWAMVADCIDYQQYRTGIREEGSVYAVYSLFRKIAQGVGASVIAVVMEKAGYDGNLGANQPAQVAMNIKNTTIMLFLIGSVLVAFSLLVIYNLGKKQTEEMTAALGLEGNVADINESIVNRND